MNIKNLVKSQSARHIILKSLFWVPDKTMLSLQYRAILHRKLNWRNPQRFTEKIQFYKALYRNPLMLECTDKYKVRNYVVNKLGTDKYLNELYQVCSNANELNFSQFPNQFVIKTTDGGNGDNVFICKDKTQIDIPTIQRKINKWRHRNYPVVSREWAYTGAKASQIIVEKFLYSPESENMALYDYKFSCFNGKFKYLWVDIDRYTNHRRVYWDENLQRTNVFIDYPPTQEDFQLPNNIQEMIQIAEKLSEDFPFARIDLYNISGKIIFGEITFYPASGYSIMKPDTLDFDLGNLFNINF